METIDLDEHILVDARERSLSFLEEESSCSSNITVGVLDYVLEFNCAINLEFCVWLDTVRVVIVGRDESCWTETSNGVDGVDGVDVGSFIEFQQYEGELLYPRTLVGVRITEGVDFLCFATKMILAFHFRKGSERSE